MVCGRVGGGRPADSDEFAVFFCVSFFHFHCPIVIIDGIGLWSGWLPGVAMVVVCLGKMAGSAGHQSDLVELSGVAFDSRSGFVGQLVKVDWTGLVEEEEEGDGESGREGGREKECGREDEEEEEEDEISATRVSRRL
ncbi:unnamed protein product [Mesocestoides corti]|uniref:Uncharacterized protein n=1 Tax=Mesocestoides corti TaxID=53468 RepID=A0A3P6GU43_MESCO|nr:unnamed protein product [Mesocestoides corti]